MFSEVPMDLIFITIGITHVMVIRVVFEEEAFWITKGLYCLMATTITGLHRKAPRPFLATHAYQRENGSTSPGYLQVTCRN